MFLELFQIMLIKLTQELDSCNYNEFLIALDGMLSNIPQAAAAGVNMATQIVSGFTNKDTSIYIAVNRIEAGMADDNNWYDFGAGFQLGLAQLLKVSAGESDIEVTPTGFWSTTQTSIKIISDQLKTEAKITKREAGGPDRTYKIKLQKTFS